MCDSFKMTTHNHGEMTVDQTSYLTTPVPDHNKGSTVSEQGDSTFQKTWKKRYPGTLAELTGRNCPSFIHTLQLFYILSSMQSEPNSTALTKHSLKSGFWCNWWGVYISDGAQFYIKFDFLMEIHFHSLLFPIDYNNSQQQHLMVTYDKLAEFCSRS